jgi:hypothetical protein
MQKLSKDDRLKDIVQKGIALLKDNCEYNQSVIKKLDFLPSKMLQLVLKPLLKVN